MGKKNHIRKPKSGNQIFMQPTSGIPCKINNGLVHHQNINGFSACIMLADSKPELRKSKN